MKLLLVFLFLSFSSFALATDVPNLVGNFEKIGLTPKVVGNVEIYFNNQENDVLVVKDFMIKGGIVLDVKICGDIEEYPPFQNICLSLGNIDEKTKYHEFEIPPTMKVYKLVKIFDADVGVDMAKAVLH